MATLHFSAERCVLAITIVIMLASHTLAQNNVSMDAWQATEQLKNKKEEVYFTGSTFTFVPGNMTPSGFNEGNIIIPATVPYASFMQCTFNGNNIVAEGNTTIWISNCKGNVSVYAQGQILINNRSEIGTIGSKSKQLNIEIIDSNVLALAIDSADVAMLIIQNSTVTDITIRNSRFLRPSPISTSLYFENRQFNTPEADSIIANAKRKNDGVLDLRSHQYMNIPQQVWKGYAFNNMLADNMVNEKMTIVNTTFATTTDAVLPIYNSELSYVLFDNTHLGMLDLYGTSITKAFEFNNSTLQGLNLFKTNIETSSISGFTFDKLASKLVVFNPRHPEAHRTNLPDDERADSIVVYDQSYTYDNVFYPVIDTLRVRTIKPYDNNSVLTSNDKDLFIELSNGYSKLYSLYKQRQDIESANACYAELKEAYTKKLKKNYLESPSVRLFFRWQLSNIVRLYTNHGTDPALAITISFWTIFLFAVFYFFFPSEWDAEDKRELIRKFRLFVEKNEHGYWKPFLKLSKGVTLSFVNALTLSLNAYTTLGFGNIPTKGFARYACVVQGFIGWFMLSIFSVALINQVLF